MYHVETRTDLYMIQVVTEMNFRIGSGTQWVLGAQNQLRSKLIIKTPVPRLYC